MREVHLRLSLARRTPQVPGYGKVDQSLVEQFGHPCGRVLPGAVRMSGGCGAVQILGTTRLARERGQTRPQERCSHENRLQNSAGRNHGYPKVHAWCVQNPLIGCLSMLDHGRLPETIRRDVLPVCATTDTRFRVYQRGNRRVAL